MTIKQNKGQTILFAVITLIAVVGLFCFAIFDIRKLPHDYSFILDNSVAYWVFKSLCFVGCFFATAGDIYLFKQLFSKEPLIEICDEYFYDNSSAISLGKIDWSEMERVYIKGGFLNIKLKKVFEFLAEGNKVKISVMTKGSKKVLARGKDAVPELFARVLEIVGDKGSMESKSKPDERTKSIIVAPAK